MRPADPFDERPALPGQDPEPSWLQRMVSTVVVCGVATALFIGASGYTPGGRAADGPLAVAACWHAIEDAGPAEPHALHAMRVACQQLESGMDRQGGEMVASGE